MYKNKNFIILKISPAVRWNNKIFVLHIHLISII